MKVCIIGNGLVSLTLANTLINKGLSVDVIFTKKQKNYDQGRTIGISKSNVQYFNKNIANIQKILWKIKKIKIFTENFSNDEVLNFSNVNNQIFSIVQNHKLYRILEKNLHKKKNFKFKKNENYKKILKQKYDLIVNCDYNHEITKKFFSNRLKKNYDSFAYTTIINHQKIKKNEIADQVFTKNGPIAFLPISSKQTSIVCSLRNSSIKKKININQLIKKFNTKYKIVSFSGINKFKLESSNLRKYYYNNILAFGDLLHKLHPLAGQGFNMSLRDIIQLVNLIDKRIELGINLDSSICIDFQKKTKDKNYLFSQGIDLIYELFNLESKTKNKLLSKSINFVGKNKTLNSFFKKFADDGLISV